MNNKIIMMISAVLCLWHNTAAQEWKAKEHYSYYNDESIFAMKNAWN